MAENSKIEWCDHTFNPWIGCTKCSPGCAHCYAAEQDKFRTSDPNWRKPLAWSQLADRDEYEIKTNGVITDESGAVIAREYHRPRVFCASLADWLDDEVEVEWLADLLELIRDTPNLDWLLLTKRPENFAKRMSAVLDFYRGNLEIFCAVYQWIKDWLDGTPPSNVWIGTTVENQAMADTRIPELLKIPAKVRFLSCEPLLGEVNLARSYPDEFCVCTHCGHCGEGDYKRECSYCGCRKANPDSGDCSKCGKGSMQDMCPECDCLHDYDAYLHPDSIAEGYERLPGIHWVICGGESGSNARPMHPDWARSLRDQCAAAAVPFLFKQWGEWVWGLDEDRFVQGGEETSKNAHIWMTTDGERGECWIVDDDGHWQNWTGNPPCNRNGVVAKNVAVMHRCGKSRAGRLLDGVDHNAFPEVAS